FAADPIEGGGLPAVVDLLRVLTLLVGPPVVILTATTPLLSAWFAAGRSPSDERDPYMLYVISNAASLAALVAFPFLIAPAVGLSRQMTLWTGGFAILAGVLALAGFAARRASVGTGSAHRITNPAPCSPAVGWQRRLRWSLLAAVPAGLLAAVTNFISVDLIAAPMLWIGPLILYLGSFIVAFSERGRSLVPRAATLTPAVVTLLWVPIGSVGGWPVIALILMAWAGLAIVATALHGRLAMDRPPPDRLTEFYLVQSIGGVAGGAFVAILAPSLFPGVWEYPILLAGALAALALKSPGAARHPASDRPDAPVGRRFDFGPFFAGAGARLGPYGVVTVVVLAIMATDRSVALEAASRWFLVGGLILLVGGPPRFLAVATAFTLAIATLVLPGPALLRDRSFFGVTEVLRSAEEQVTVLMNGTTLHGMQSIDPLLRHQPTTYYAPSGPLGDVFSWLEEARPAAAIGVVGLGAGTVAAYGQPGQRMTFFEIDPLVVRVATDERFFTYLSDAPIPPRIILGDARLSIRDLPSGAFDLLVLDAFSSDAVPAHLLTVEALSDDLRVLRPGGLLVAHVSNRYYDLAAAIKAAGDRLGLVVLDKGYSPSPSESAALAAISPWVLVTDDPEQAEAFRSLGWQTAPGSGLEPLTDDHPDVLRFLSIGR
ncbi:MAG: fused MFS/spermidine synthase, partial [Candidatus Limnocylindrales bacterium]